DVVHQIEFTIARAFPAPVSQVLAIRAELDHARINVGVGHRQGAVLGERDIGWLVERILAVILLRRARTPWHVLAAQAHRPARGRNLRERKRYREQQKQWLHSAISIHDLPSLLQFHDFIRTAWIALYSLALPALAQVKITHASDRISVEIDGSRSRRFDRHGS